MPNPLSDFGRFSDPALLILSSLAEGPKHGYAMMEDIWQFSGTRLEPGTLYGALVCLEQRGWIVPLPSAQRHRPYRLSAAGVSALQEQLATMSRVVATGQRSLQVT